MDIDIRQASRSAVSGSKYDEWRSLYTRWRAFGGAFEWQDGDRLTLREVEWPWFTKPTVCVLRKRLLLGGYVTPEDGDQASFKPGFSRALRINSGLIYVTQGDMDNSSPLPPL